MTPAAFRAWTAANRRAAAAYYRDPFAASRAFAFAHIHGLQARGLITREVARQMRAEVWAWTHKQPARGLARAGGASAHDTYDRNGSAP
jgi:hypothetical protein